MTRSAAMTCFAVTAALLLAVVTPSTAQEMFGRNTSCSLSCPAASKFSYQVGMVHVFDYHGSAKFLSGSREPQLGVSARAHITVASRCEMILALSHVRLVDSIDHDEAFSADLIRNPLRFGFTDGRVMSVCPADDEPRWALNLKRAILSTFQNSMEDFDNIKVEWIKETDVNGLCTSNYTSVQQDKGVYNITRSRSSTCIAPQPAPTNNIKTSILQLLPVLYSEQKCLQMISGGNLKEALCRENLRLPWDTNDELPVASLTTGLKLVYQFKADFVVIPNYQARRLSLAIEWEDTTDDLPPPEWLSLALSMIRSLHQDTPPSPALFYRLSTLLKDFNYSQLSDLFIKMSPKIWSTGQMAISKLATEPSMKLLLDFVKYGSLRISKLNNLFKLYDVSPAMVDLIESVDSSSDHMGVKLRGYCDAHNNCRDQQKILDILGELANDAGPLKCDSTALPDKESSYNPSSYDDYSPEDERRQEEYESAQTLSKWADIGYWNKSMKSSVSECIINKEDTSVKYSALAALRSAPCDQYDYEQLFTLTAAQQSSQSNQFMSIMTYLTLVRCPPANYSSYLTRKLTNSDITQETSFIWTHLSNNPGKIATEVVQDPTILNKFNGKSLKFSRNMKKQFVLLNKTYELDFDIVFSDYKLRPQYVSLKLTIDNDTVPLVDFEMHEKNSTIGGYSSSVDTYCVRSMKVKGNEVYSEQTSLSSPSSWFNFEMLYMHAYSFGFQVISLFSFSFISKYFGYSDLSVFEKMDVLLQYPTSIGMPFHIKLNKTTGYISEKSTFPSFFSKQFDVQMLIDATYTNVGTKIQSTCDVLPSINITNDNDVFQFIVDLPEKKSKLLDFNFGLYNIENERLSSRYSKDNTPVESMCLPLLRNLTGSTLCWEYCPQSNWWPINRGQYSLVYVRDDGFRGHNLTVLTGDDCGFYYEELGNPRQKWHFVWRTLAQFVNAKIRTPYFNLKGSGTFDEKSLCLEEPGQAMNITGLLSCNNEVAPFSLTGFNIVNKETDERQFNAYFNSSLFESRLLSTYENGDNCSIDVTLPYRVKGGEGQNVRFTVKSVEYNVTDNKDKTRWEMGTSLGFSAFPSAVLAAVVFVDTTKVIEYYDYVREDIDVDLKAEMSCSNHSIVSKASGKWYSNLGEVTSTVDYSHNNYTANWTESFVMQSSNNRVINQLICGDRVVYSLDANAYMGPMMHSNLTFVMPLQDESYPLLQIDIDQSYNYPKQQFHLVCRKTYRDHGMKLNVTAGRVLDEATELPAGLASDLIHHRGVIDLSCDSSNDSFRIDAESRLSDTLQDLDLSVDVTTPFQRWDKHAFTLKLEKKGQLLKTSVQENRRGAEPVTYVMEGTTHADVNKLL